MATYPSYTTSYIYSDNTSSATDPPYTTSWYTTTFIWSNWTSNTITTTSDSNYTWATWAGNSDTYYYQSPREITQSERNQQEIYRIEAEEKRKEEQQQRELAEKKAQELLGELIGAKELEVYRKTGRVLVKGKDCDYLISKSGYAKKVEKNKVVDLCIHLQNQHEVPATDGVIALSLLAKNDGKAFEKQANRVREYDQLPEEFKQAACF